MSTPPRNMFHDFQDYISEATFNTRSSVYRSFKNLTRDLHNPFISLEQFASEKYDNSPTVVDKDEHQNLVPAFWILTLGTIVGTKTLPRYKFIGVLGLSGAVAFAYFPKTLESLYKNAINK